ncbi:MAG: type VI secretion system-associated protein TagO [Rhodospirillaceae bacterium]|nr:type VI secretion system-associated protein TagO [Rhodospirillaceae bacterium]
MYFQLSVLLTLFAIHTFVPAAQAAERDSSTNATVGLKRCAQIAAPTQRLKCYDALSGHSSTIEKTEKSKSQSDNWRVIRKTNPIDDTPVVTVYTDAIEGQSRFGKIPQLIFRCQNNRTEAIILWQTFIGLGRHGSGQRVRMRLDLNDAQNQSWLHSTSGTATFARRPIPLIRKWVEHNRLVVQTTPYSQGPVTAIFDLTGLARALRPLTEACNWTLKTPTK